MSGFHIDIEDMKERVIKVKIIKTAFIEEDSSNNNIKEINEDEVAKFLSALSNIKFTYPLGLPRELQGYIYYNG